MVQDAFDSVLKELGSVLKIPDLHLDASQTCLIKFSNGLMVNLEPFEKGDFMLISTIIAEIPPGRYRESVFREALKENAISAHHSGIFGLKKRKQELVLFSLISLREINGEKIAAFLHPYIEKALGWKNAIAGGVVPSADTMRTSQIAPAGIFGLRP